MVAMDIDIPELEGIARELHESTGDLLPVDAFELADLCGLELRPWGKSTAKVDVEARVIRYPIKARPVRQHGLIAHELVHDLRHQHGCGTWWSCKIANIGAGIIMLPREPFTRDVWDCDWDLFELQDRHPNASAQMIIIRMTQVSDATSWVWDQGKVRDAYGIDKDEDVSEIVDRVLSTEAPLHGDGMRAWPVFDGHHRRVVVVKPAA